MDPGLFLGGEERFLGGKLRAWTYIDRCELRVREDISNIICRIQVFLPKERIPYCLHN